MEEINKTLKKYENFKDTYIEGFIGIPKGVGGLKKNFYGSIRKFRKIHPNFKYSEKIPMLFYMHGSAGLSYGKKYKDAALKSGFLFFAPNSYELRDRPTYESPTSIKNYERVHKVRVAEVFYNIHQVLRELKFVDEKNIFLMGSSEGALAAAKYSGREFKGRIIAAYSCENGYYSKDFKIGARKKDPFLNIIGTHDQFFGEFSMFDKNKSGNCSKALLEYKNAKVVLLPKTKHNVIENRYTIPEVINFLKFWTKA